jgi:exosortase D (VPLPA-CTERM-specific)
MHVADTVLPNVSSYQRSGWAAFAVLLALLIAAAFASLQRMVVNEWFGSEEYSHAALIPLLAAYLVRQRADVFELPPRGHVVGVLILALGCATLLLGKLSTIHAVAQYGFLIGVFGAFGVAFGGNVLRRLVWPLLVLVFMVPLPNFLYQPLSGQLQLISSELGVALIRAFGISVFLHGNVIDLGTYQLQVLEACNGLRYLFPLASLGYLFAYLYRGPLWQRVLLVAASTPITIALNSFRIAVIGVTVEHWGIAAADGVLHAFEGWLVFMACVGLLLCTAKILAHINGYRGRLTGAFAIALGPAPAQFRHAPISAPWAVGAAIVLLLPTIVIAQNPLHGDMTATATRRSFAEFPMDLGDGWRGRTEVLDAGVLASLQLDDYVMADFANDVGGRVNFYSAFYGSQLAGRSAHSPRSCLPGDGWRITELSTIDVVDPVTARQVPLNRAVITRGNETQLVYYWFEQRGRVLANEYLVKWYILRDALGTQRTDGALVRLIAPVYLDGGTAAADATLRDFYVRTKTRLPEFIPG